MVEHRVLTFGKWCKVRKHSPGMDVSWCAAHEPVGFLYHSSHIQVVTMVEKILKGNQIGEMREPFIEEERKGSLRTPRLTFLSEEWRKQLPQSPVSGNRAAEAHGSR